MILRPLSSLAPLSLGRLLLDCCPRSCCCVEIFRYMNCLGIGRSSGLALIFSLLLLWIWSKVALCGSLISLPDLIGFVATMGIHALPVFVQMCTLASCGIRALLAVPPSRMNLAFISGILVASRHSDGPARTICLPSRNLAAWVVMRSPKYFATTSFLLALSQRNSAFSELPDFIGRSSDRMISSG